jgi:tetratricopeptide (TPR) repeat protein
MTYRFFISTILVLSSLIVSSQPASHSYQTDTNKADSFFDAKKYDSAVQLYTKAFNENNDLGKSGHRYKAAVCYAMLKRIDNAFIQLNKISAAGKFANYDLISKDINFINLHSDKRWQEVLLRVKENKRKEISNILDN